MTEQKTPGWSNTRPPDEVYIQNGAEYGDHLVTVNRKVPNARVFVSVYTKGTIFLIRHLVDRKRRIIRFTTFGLSEASTVALKNALVLGVEKAIEIQKEAAK